MAVFLDFKRAFEIVNREILLRKLDNMSIKGAVLRWFNFYLVNRQQRVKFKDNISDALNVLNGVPQGTVLGLLLFLLYVNDIVSTVSRCKIEMALQ